MKRFFTFLLTLMVVSSIFGCGTLNNIKKKEVGTKDSSALIKHMGLSTVALVAQRRGDTLPYCTGVWVDKNLIMTAHHCVEGAAQLAGADEDEDIDVIGLKIHYIIETEVTGIEEEPTGWHLGTVVMSDMRHDLALVKAEGVNIPKHDVAKIASRSPGLGEKLHFVGHVKGLYWTYVEGNVAAYRDSLPINEKRLGPYLQVSAPVYFGNSGGGAFNTDGEVVGIASFIIKVPLTAFYVHADSMRKIIANYKEDK